MPTLNEVQNMLYDYRDPEYGDYGWSAWEFERDDNQPYLVPGLGMVEVEESKSGSEGDWETPVYVIFRVTLPQGGGYFFYRKTGYYASHAGTNWDGPFEEVEPFERKIKDWRKVS